MNQETKWTQSKLQQFINELIEERHDLEYKGADALQRTGKYKKKITKDVSAMANAAGGVLIYGISEYNEKDKRHLPKGLDAINRVEYSKEWLEQVISNIRPRIDGIIIYPVPLNTGANDVAYVVEIPRSTTAHQARDYKYYFRYNFESVPMEDSQIRDVMHRGTRPNVSIRFLPKLLRQQSDGNRHKYLLRLFVKNSGEQVVSHYQLLFSVPEMIPVEFPPRSGALADHITIEPRLDKGGFRFSCRSRGVLFPKQELEVFSDLGLIYTVDNDVYNKIQQHNPTLNWQLFADDMIPKHENIPFSELHNF